ncbi:hypothetical protein BDP27DRAFT_1422808 [Rhodocollybia butyracea]|uniref:Uncharacterized protein n=1 Tax=Rhodocollybia butyracea TaxID=206335 RepID=A0A9P5U683_9AGAR|nr:hypothetical protein BDP27DRAFT_1422808 [Rhodocollybia butyracea]
MALAYSFLSQILSMFPHDPLSHISGILDFSSQGIQQLLVNFKQLWEQHGLSVAGRDLAEAVVQDSTLRCCWAVKEEGFQAEVCFQMIESIKRLGEEFGMELSKSQTPPPAPSSPSPLTAPTASSPTPTLALNALKLSPHALTLVSPSKPTSPSFRLQPTSEFAREVAELRKAGRKLEVFMDEHVMGLEHTAGTPPARVHLSNTPTECTPVPYIAPVTAVPPTGLRKHVKHNVYGAFGSLLLRSSRCPSQSGTLMPSPSPTETPHHHICAPNQCSHSWRWRSTVSNVPPPSQSGLSVSWNDQTKVFLDSFTVTPAHERVRKQVAAYNIDVKASVRDLDTLYGKLSLPRSQWKNVLLDTFVKFNEIFSNSFTIEPDESDLLVIGDTHLEFQKSKVASKIKKATQWNSAWRVYEQAVKFAFKGQELELKRYWKHINNLFEARHESTHKVFVVSHPSGILSGGSGKAKRKHTETAPTSTFASSANLPITLDLNAQSEPEVQLEPAAKMNLSENTPRVSGKSMPYAGIYLNKAIKSDLSWYVSHVQLSSGVWLFEGMDWNHCTKTDFTIYCDVCLEGMGFWVPELRLGFYSPMPSHVSLKGLIFFFEALCVVSAIHWYCQTMRADTTLTRHLRLTVFTDNFNTFDIFDSLKASPPYNILLHSAVNFLITFDVDLRVKHVKGEDNTVADAISQHQFIRAYSLVPDILIQPFLPPQEALGEVLV